MLHLGKFRKKQNKNKTTKQTKRTNKVQQTYISFFFFFYLLRPQTLFVSTYKLNIIGNSFESCFHSCTQIWTASRSYTESLFFNSPHVAQSCNRSDRCMSTRRRALLHSTHINSSVLLYNILLYLCVCVNTAEMFFLYSICLHIYNTVAFNKENNSTVLFFICLSFGSLRQQKVKNKLL